MEPTAGLSAAIAAARAAEPRFVNGSSAEVLVDLAAVEELGRIVDGLRLAGSARR